MFTSTEFSRMELGPDPAAAQQQISYLALAVAGVSCGCVCFPATSRKTAGLYNVKNKAARRGKGKQEPSGPN